MKVGPGDLDGRYMVCALFKEALTDFRQFYKRQAFYGFQSLINSFAILNPLTVSVF